MRTSAPAAAALALGASVLFLGAAPASAGTAPSPSASAQTAFVEINPSTVPAGDQITIRASCVENLVAATVTGSPSGTISVKPNHGFLTATTVIPTTAKIGDYRLTLTCPDKKTIATADLHVVVRLVPSRGPATGGGGTAPGRDTPLLIGGGLAAMVAGLVLAAVSFRRRGRFG
jgi:hypothetical protein